MMRDLECKQTADCGNICGALREQGLDVPRIEDNCQASEAFYEDGDQIGAHFEGEATDPALAELLVSSLYGVLTVHERKNPELHRLIGSHKNVLQQRSSRWAAMVSASQSGRAFTDIEYTYHSDRITAAAMQVKEASANVASENIIQAQAAFDSGTLTQFGIVFDEHAVDILDRLAANYLDAKPTLLVGDKGIAKTQLARYMAQFASGGKSPIFLSGHGDQMGDEFVGRYEQDKVSGRFEFHEGQVINAMREGLPVVIDEINLADQSITMRLQDILLRKPGDIVRLSENGGSDIIIKPGFTVIATANEASERYKHRVSLDPAFRDRFDVLTMSYPDSENEKPLQEIPATSYRLALAAACDQGGNVSRHINLTALETFVRLAHITQRLYSTPLEDSGISLGDESTTSFLSADKPVMNDCITPRTLVNTIQRVSNGNNGLAIVTEMRRLIDGLNQGGSLNNSHYANKALALLGK